MCVCVCTYEFSIICLCAYACMFTCIHAIVSLACVLCMCMCVYCFVRVCVCIKRKARECASYSFAGLLLITNCSRSAFPCGIVRRYCENCIEWKLEIRASYYNRFVQKISVLGLLWQQVRKHKSSTCVYTST